VTYDFKAGPETIQFGAVEAPFLVDVAAIISHHNAEKAAILQRHQEAIDRAGELAKAQYKALCRETEARIIQSTAVLP
jgi:hypothetical protein